MLDSEARKIAAQAWAQVKDANDPDFEACAQDHQAKLAYKVMSVAKSGAREDAFDEAVHAILNPPPQSPEPVEVATPPVDPAPADPAPAPKKKASAKKKSTPK